MAGLFPSPRMFSLSSSQKPRKPNPRSWRPTQDILDRMAALEINNHSHFVVESVIAALDALEASRQGASPEDVKIRQLALERDAIVKELTKLRNDPSYRLHKEWLDTIVDPQWGRKSEWGLFEETGEKDIAPF